MIKVPYTEINQDSGIDAIESEKSASDKARAETRLKTGLILGTLAAAVISSSLLSGISEGDQRVQGLVALITSSALLVSILVTGRKK